MIDKARLATLGYAAQQRQIGMDKPVNKKRRTFVQLPVPLSQTDRPVAPRHGAKLDNLQVIDAHVRGHHAARFVSAQAARSERRQRQVRPTR